MPAPTAGAVRAVMTQKAIVRKGDPGMLFIIG